MSALSVLLCFEIPVRKPLLVAFLSLNLALSLCVVFKNKYELKLLIVFVLGLILAVILGNHYTSSFGLPEDRITALEGTLLYDSSFSSSGKGLVRISVSRCRDNCGTWTTARGIVPALGSERAVVTSGLEVRLEGEFSGQLFVYESLRVTKRSWVNDLREHLIEAIERRLFGESLLEESVLEESSFRGEKEPDGPALLSSLLLLGRSEDYDFPLREAALDCGCAHVLALSGMHLSVLASLCSLVFGKRKFGKALAVLVIGVFVFVAGPRPSLVRSAIMFFLGKRFRVKERLVLAFFIQALLLPFSMLDIGCCYGYVSVFAIVYLWEVLRSPLAQLGGGGGDGLKVSSKLFSPVLLSVTVLLLCAPVQLLQDGYWCPVAIIVSPFASFLVNISMVSGLFILSFGRLEFLLWINRLSYEALAKLFEVFSGFPKAGWLGYSIMVLVVAMLEVLALVYRKIKRTKVEECSKEYRFIGKIDLNWEDLEI